VYSVETDLNPAAEERYLASLLISVTTRHLRDEALRLVAPELFYSTPLQALWAGARRLVDSGQPIDRRRLIAAAIDSDPLPPVKGRDGHGGWENTLRQVVERLGEMVPVAADFPAAVAAVTRAGSARRLVEAAERIKQFAFTAEEPSDAHGLAADEIAKLARAEVSSDSRPLAEVIDEFEKQQIAPEAMHAIPTPWWDVNGILGGGLQRGRFYIVGARPGDGKSLSTGNMAQHAAKNDYPTVMFSMEMSDVEVAGRLVSDGAEVDMGEINRRDMSSVSWDRFREYANQASAYPLWIVDRPDLTVNRVKAICRQHKRTTGLDVVVVDYLQLIQAGRSAPRQEQVAEISRALKVMSRELDCAVVVPSQLNRRSLDRERPTLADLRESGSLEQDADVVILLSRQQFEGGDMAGQYTGVITVDVAKNRQGRTGDVQMTFRGNYSRIE
jgi:replicative DNA helicase